MNITLPNHVKKILGLIFVSLCLSYTFPLMGPILVSSGMDPSLVALCLSAISLISGVIQPWVGQKLDEGRSNTPFLIAVVGIVTGLGALIAGVTNPWPLAAALLLYHVGGITLSTANRTLCFTGLDPHQKEDAAGLFFLIFNLGLAVAGLMAYLFLESYRTQLLTADLISTLAVVFVAFPMISRLKKQYATAPREEAPSSNRHQLWKVLKRNPSKIFAVFIMDLSLSLAIMMAPLLYAVHGMPAEKYTALGLAANTIIIVAIGPLLSKGARFLSRPMSLALVSVLMGLGLGLTPSIRGELSIIMVVTIWTLGEILLARVEMPMILECFNESEKGLASGTMGLIHSSSRVIAPLIAAMVIRLDPMVAGVCLMAIPILGVIPVLLRLEKRPGRLPYRLRKAA